MGCNEAVDSECFENEKPGRVVDVPAFRIDTREVSVAEYRACVVDAGCSPKGTSAQFWSGKQQSADSCNYESKGHELHPMNCVDWSQAVAYCRWSGKRLPTEAEWEKAARGTDGRKYSWGNEPLSTVELVANIADLSAKRANLGLTVAEDYDDGVAETAPVGSFPRGASPYGALDMVGNVAEWTADWQELNKYRAVRGGSWSLYPGYARVSRRNKVAPGDRFNFIGFRCAQSQ